MKVSIGRVVTFRSRTGDYDCPAIVTATTETLNPKGVEAGHIPALSSGNHVHLTVFTAGLPGLRGGAADFKVESEHPRSENVAGTYQEWDVQHAELAAEWYDKGHDTPPPGTWRWPERVSA